MPNIERKYTNPEDNIKVKPTILIFFLSLIDMHILISNKSIHIAHGLNPSTAPKIIATNGMETFFLLTFPNIGILTSSLFIFSLFTLSLINSFILFSICTLTASENPTK